MKKAVLGIDYGSRRTGIAISDPEQAIAMPLTTLDSGQLIDFLEAYMGTHQLEELVIGLPLGLHGRTTKTTRAVRKVAAQIRARGFAQKIYLYDERLTSIAAKQGQFVGGFSRKQRRERGRLDRMSAALILRGFLACTDKKHLKF